MKKQFQFFVAKARNYSIITKRAENFIEVVWALIENLKISETMNSRYLS